RLIHRPVQVGQHVTDGPILGRLYGSVLCQRYTRAQGSGTTDECVQPRESTAYYATHGSAPQIPSGSGGATEVVVSQRECLQPVAASTHFARSGTIDVSRLLIGTVGID